MHSFWDILVRPALEAAEAREIVEVGSESGRNTLQLLDWCEAYGARIHVVEPEPQYDPEQMASLHPQRFVFHQAASLEVLDRLKDVDAVLLDGDHNWYTVYHELRALERAHGEAFPLVILHDVSWPFARRDVYYAPERIPAAFRQPHARRGVARGRSKLLSEGGLAPELEKAEEEGGPRNGVLTGIEDFLAESSLPLRFEVVPVDFGLGLMASRDLLERRPALSALLDGLESHAFQKRLVGYTEERRLDDLTEQHGEVGRLREGFDLVLAELRRHEVEVKRLREMLAGAFAELEAARAKAEESGSRLQGREEELRNWQEHARGLEARVEELRAELGRVMGSHSWRITAPLRRATAVLRGNGGSQS